MKRRISLLTVVGVLVVLAVGFLNGQQPGGKDNAFDIAVIKKSGENFLKAYKAGDAKAMATQWTENGEYVSDDGTTIRGRADIEKAYTASFAKKKPPTDAEIEVTSIRFPSKDTAIEEGYFKARFGNNAPTASKYTVLHVREEGKWLMAVVREWPNEGPTLRDLEWLIGTWEVKRDDSEVRTVYEWWGDKSFIRVAISIKQKDRTRSGFQMIGKDASTGQLRTWTFDSEGSFAEATVSRDGNKWSFDSAGVLEDGSILTATNIIARIDNNAFTFQSVQRTLDGDEVEDVPPVRVERVKGK